MPRFKYNTRHGPILIIPEKDGRWQVVFDDEGLGSYHSPSAAADDVAGGHTFSPSNGIDFADLDISDDINDWERC